MVNNYIPLTAHELEVARAASERLTCAPRGDEALTHFIYDSQNEESIALPAGAVAVLLDVLQFMSRGHGITLFPRLAEVSTVEAADILNVSRPYLIKLLEEGGIPFHRVGRHRRVRMEDVVNYKEAIDLRREAILDQMVAEAQELGLYD